MDASEWFNETNLQFLNRRVYIYTIAVFARENKNVVIISNISKIFQLSHIPSSSCTCNSISPWWIKYFFMKALLKNIAQIKGWTLKERERDWVKYNCFISVIFLIKIISYKDNFIFNFLIFIFYIFFLLKNVNYYFVSQSRHAFTANTRIGLQNRRIVLR